MNYIFDTLWEFWQYLKPHGNVYLAGVPYKQNYIIISMIPENVALPSKYEKLSEAMTRDKASQRIEHFKLIKLVASKKSLEIDT